MVEQDPASSSSARKERCPSCPATGPPNYTPTPTTAPILPSPPPEDDGPDEYHWIACTGCDTWYHTVCILMDGGKTRESVPQEIRDEIDQYHQELGVWTNWSKWVERWYCAECLGRTTNPKTGRALHHPFITTTNKAFTRQMKVSRDPTQLVKRKSIKRFPDESTPPASLIPKRARTEFTQKASPAREMGVLRGEPGEVSLGGRPLYHDKAVMGLPSPATSGEQDHLERRSEDVSMTVPSPAASNNAEPGGPARPKRQVALNQPDYHALHHHIATPTKKWLDLINNPAAHNTVIHEGKPPRIPARLLTKQWVESPVPATSDSAYPPHLPPTLFYGEHRQPILIRPEDGGFEGLGGRLPSKDITYNDIARLVGPNVSVDVIDVATQQSSQWTLGKWAETITTRSDPLHPSNNAAAGPSKTFNIISLEITGTELAKQVSPPTLVREIDWVDNFWNFGKGGKGSMVDVKGGLVDGDLSGGMGGMGVGNGVKEEGKDKGKEKGKGRVPTQWPKVQLYCLMGMKGAWTDWHVDFAASSVYYTVLKGAKTFFFIRPTEKNLKAYTEWCSSFEKQQNTWLGDMCDQEVTKTTLHAGDTMIIPAGYIHAVYTPLDSIVFGGNFLHSYNIPTQLRLRQIEIDTKVPQRFRFPHLDKLCWYTANRYNAQLRELWTYKPNTPGSTHPRVPVVVLKGLGHLIGFLRSQVDLLENEGGEVEEKKRKFVWDRLPREVVDDPGGLARELEWRVERELTKAGVGVGTGAGTGAVKQEGMSNDEAKKGVVGGKGDKSKNRGVIPAAISRISDFQTIPWTTRIEPVKSTTDIIRKSRPGEIDGEEEAEKDVTTRREVRHRVKVVTGVGAVWEEQDVVVKQTRIVWRDRAAEDGGSSMGQKITGGGTETMDNEEMRNLDETEVATVGDAGDAGA